MRRSLYDRAGDVSAAIAAFIRDQGTGHVMLLGELGLYGCHMGPMLAGRVMREYRHVVANDLQLVASIQYDVASRRIMVNPPPGPAF